MATYPTKIDGKLKLPEIQSAIRGEEAGASTFTDSVPDTKPGSFDNFATFDELDPGTVPKPIWLKKTGEPAPAGTAQIWAGKMWVDKVKTDVTAYRTQ